MTVAVIPSLRCLTIVVLLSRRVRVWVMCHNKTTNLDAKHSQHRLVLSHNRANCGVIITHLPLCSIKHSGFSSRVHYLIQARMRRVSCSVCRHKCLRWRCCCRHGAPPGLLMFSDVLDLSPSSHTEQGSIMRTTQQLLFTASADTRCSFFSPIANLSPLACVVAKDNIALQAHSVKYWHDWMWPLMS
jgi:hypothetical protein